MQNSGKKGLILSDKNNLLLLNRVGWKDFTDNLYKIPETREEYLHFLEFTYNTKLIPPFPMYLYLEPTNICNMNCPVCANSRMKRKKGYLDFNLAKKILDECGKNSLYYMTLHSQGEPLLHKELDQIVAYAKKQVKVVAVITNGLLLDEDYIRRLSEAGLDSLVISFAVTPEKFKLTRGEGYDKVERAIYRVADYKEKHNLKDPFVKLVCILTDETEKEKQIFVDKFKPVVNAFDLRPLHKMSIGNALYERYGTGFDILPDIRIPCRQLWKHLVVDWSGKATACSQDIEFQMSVGSVNNNTIQELWNNDLLNQQRLYHLSNQYSQIDLCKDCPDWDWQ